MGAARVGTAVVLGAMAALLLTIAVHSGHGRMEDAEKVNLHWPIFSRHAPRVALPEKFANTDCLRVCWEALYREMCVRHAYMPPHNCLQLTL